jgi:hypothetical protein
MKIAIRFADARVDGPPPGSWDEVLLRITGDFAIEVDGRALYSEQEFPLVEFAYRLHRWLICAAGVHEDFAYVSMESDEEPLVWFTSSDEGWVIGARDQQWHMTEPAAATDLLGAARAYSNSLAPIVRQLAHTELVGVFEGPNTNTTSD